MERKIIIRVFTFEDDKIDLEGNTLADMKCSFLSTVEMKQRFYNIETDSKKSDKEIIEYYINNLKRAGICISEYEIIKLPKRLKG